MQPFVAPRRLWARRIAAFTAAICLWSWSAAGRAQEASRHTLVRVDGTLEQSPDLNGWHMPSATVTINGRLLFEPTAMPRWLRDNTLEAEPLPPALLEWFGGDTLPGRVAAFVPPAETTYDRVDGHLLVEPHVPLDWPDEPRRALRVSPVGLRRIVWDWAGEQRYLPGTVLFRDGRRLTFRAARFTPDGLRLLLSEGTEDVQLSQLAQLHFPQADAWESYVAQLAELAPQADGWLQRLTTTFGLVATTSDERFLSLGYQGGAEPYQWVQPLQPAWALDPLYVRHRSVLLRTWFQPHSIPLTWLAPVRTAQRSLLGGGWRAQLDRNAQGGPLRVQGLDYPWGYGVHGETELEFLLPEYAADVWVRCALDHVAGRGGCVKARVLAGREALAPLWESPVLVGSAAPVDSGHLALPAGSGPQRVVLQSDAVLAGRPAGADPLDVRDALDWLEPLVTVDGLRLAAQTRAQAWPRLAAWAEWQLPPEVAAQVRLRHIWDPTQGGSRGFRLCAAGPVGGLTLARSLNVTPQQGWLVVAADYNGEFATAAQLGVTVAGQPVAAAATTDRRNLRNDPQPLVAPLTAYYGQTVDVALQVNSGDDRAWTDWRAIALVDRPPGLLRVFEDESPAEALQPALQTSLVYRGRQALEVSPNRELELPLTTGPAAVREWPQFGEYRYVLYAWRKRGGGRMCLQLGHDGRYGPPPDQATRSFRYDAGAGPPSYGAALRVHAAQLADEWYVVQRDLFADFGAFDLTGLKFTSPEGELAWLDQVYLARTPDDFRWLAPWLDGEADLARWGRVAGLVGQTTTDLAAAQPLLAAFAPGFQGVALGSLGLVEQHAYKRGVLETHPAAPDQPCVLRWAAQLPSGRRTRLKLPVTCAPGTDWQVMVKVDGVAVQNATVNDGTTAGKWLEAGVDLSAYAGKLIKLELEHHGLNWIDAAQQTETGFWGQIELAVE